MNTSQLVMTRVDATAEAQTLLKARVDQIVIRLDAVEGRLTALEGARRTEGDYSARLGKLTSIGALSANREVSALKVRIAGIDARIAAYKARVETEDALPQFVEQVFPYSFGPPLYEAQFKGRA